jgi:hypothetical protein
MCYIYIYIYISMRMGICICLCASVTPTWSINESVTTEEDVNDDDEEPKKKNWRTNEEKRNIDVKSRFICHFLLEYQDKRNNSFIIPKYNFYLIKFIIFN